MSGIICWIWLTSAIQASQLTLLRWQNEAQQKSGEERVTTISRPKMNLTAKMPSIVSSSTSSNPVKTWYGYQDPGRSVASDDRSGKLERPSPPDHSKEDHGQCWLWSCGAWSIRKPEKMSWNAMQQVPPHHEEPLLDGNAQSVRYGDDSWWIGETWES